MAGTCECGNELLGSTKCGEFLDKVKTSQLLKDSAPWSTELQGYRSGYGAVGVETRPGGL